MHALRTKSRLGRSKRLGAFTLTEVLVVIAVIGILAAILLPVLSKGKDRAIRTVDLNNLKQIVTAMHLHATDHKDELPWSNWYRGDGTNRQGWLYTLDPSATGPARFKAQTGAFWPILQSEKIYRCPMDKPDHPLYSQRAQQISSYVLNGAVNGYQRIEYPTRTLAEFKADDIAFWETDESEPSYFNDGASRPDEGVSARHAQGAIMASFGGAVEFVKFDTWYAEEARTNRSRLWCYPGSPNGR
jgi:prepilin-type N-terminal cleavage/methylation domain-containing protein